jgi:uncharacterized repeat protein (TIGR03806 family)
VEPLWDYDGSVGHCSVSGQVYRGTEHPELFGKHILFDNVSQRVWALTTDGTNLEDITQIATLPGSGFFSGPTSAGVDHQGEVYITKLQGGRIYKFSRAGSTVPEPPSLLSKTGAFSDLATLTPAEGFVPYSVNTPLWSDRALKARWIMIPNDGFPNTSAEKIGFSADGNWSFPAGTVLVKHFALPLVENDPGSAIRLETRFLVITEDGGAYGITYKWLPDGSDAVLLADGASEDFAIESANGETYTQTWDFPNRSQCMECHTPAAGFVLGARTHQFNRDNYYPRSGQSANQLRTLYGLGWFDDSYRSDLQKFYLKAHPLDDTSAPLEERVRSYLDSNCSQCHQPGGVRARFDARYTTPLNEQSLLYGSLFGSFIGDDEGLVVPGRPDLSTIPHRMNLIGSGQMPPLGKNLIDPLAVQALTDWIHSLQTRPGVTLSAPPSASTETFEVGIKSSIPLSELTPEDFTISNGLATDLSPNPNSAMRTLTVMPAGSGPVSVSLAANRTVDSEGLGNYPSNLVLTNIVDSSLATYLPLDEGSGNTAADFSGNNNDAALINMETNAWIQGSCHGGLLFDGSDDSLTLTRPVSGDFTITLWLKTSQQFLASDHGPASTHLINCDAPGTSNDFVLAGSQNDEGRNHATFFTGNPQISILGTSAINTGEWVHLAATREQETGTMSLYVNGILEATSSGANSLPLTDQSIITIGGGNFYQGLMDEIRIYDRALASGEVGMIQRCSRPEPAYEQFIENRLPGITHLHRADLDIEGDGMSNLLEWAFDLSPTERDVDPTRPAIDGNQRFTLTFPRLETEGAPEYELMVSEDSLNWIPAGDDAVISSVNDLAGPTEAVTVSYHGALGQDSGRLFARIRVTE